MQQIKSYFNFSNIKTTKKSNTVENDHSLFQLLYFMLSWKDPFFTWLCFLGWNLFFCLAVKLEMKFFGMLFINILVLFILDSLRKKIVPLICDKQSSADIEDFIECLRCGVLLIGSLKKENPSIFCFSISSFFLIMAWITSKISNTLLIYALVWGMFFIPFFYGKIPDSAKGTIKSIIKTISNSEGIIKEEDLIPLDIHDEDLESISNETNAESVTNSLISEITSIPSHLSLEDEKYEITEEDLIPKPIPDNVSSDSDSDFKPINFDSAHFKQDSSSEDEFQFTQGLEFSKDVLDSQAPTQTDSKLWNFINQSASYFPMDTLNRFINSPLKIIPNNSNVSEAISKSSSESDFEVIDNESLK